MNPQLIQFYLRNYFWNILSVTEDLLDKLMWEKYMLDVAECCDGEWTIARNEPYDMNKNTGAP